MPNEPDKRPTVNEPPADSLESPEPDSGLPATGSGPATPPPKPPLLRRLRTLTNIYPVVFGLLIIVAAVVIFVALHGSGGSNKPSSASSLTDQQLSTIKGSTTLVGDAKQTLDVQSNSIFEGQVMVRSDLNVAGAIKVGGGLSLPSVSVGGAGSFGQLGVNSGLKVGGDTTLQGSLTVQKNLNVSGAANFGNLSVGTLSVTSLQLNGDLSLNRHIVTSGGTPSRSNGSALGGGGTASVSGSDTAGTVSINTGSGPPAGCFVTINFVHGYGRTPHVIISPANSSAGTLQYYTNRNTGSFSICTASAPAGGTNYVFDYAIFD